jgi:hypothetical protein
MKTWAGVALSCAALLVASGIPKLRQPEATVAALRSVGVTRMGATGARLLTMIEITIGSTAVVLGGRWPDAAVSAVYIGFSVFLILALRQSTGSCGCTGRVDTPPTLAHLVMTTLFAIGSAAAAVNGGKTGMLAFAQAANPARSLTVLAYAALVTWLGWAILDLAPSAPRQPGRGAT